MLMIRLQRTGRENLPTFRVVVAEKRAPAKGSFLEIVGHYQPHRGLETFSVQQDRIDEWVKKGATPSQTVARLLKRTGAMGMERFITPYTKRKSKNAVEGDAAAANG